jgi:hypothetical protein
VINNFETFDIKILIVTVFFASMPFTNIEVLATMFRYYGHIAPLITKYFEPGLFESLQIIMF